MAEAEKAGLVKSYNLTESSLQSKYSDDHMAEIEKFISWQEVGRHLPKITRLHLRDIGNDGRTQGEKRRLLLDKWEESNGDDATYDAMITAMLKAGKKAEATSVCQLLQSLSGLISMFYMLSQNVILIQLLFHLTILPTVIL